MSKSISKNSPKKEYDVIVVGAGPAGSTAAKKLAENGISTLLIDKEKFPRKKPCGGGLTQKIFKRFLYVEKTDVVEVESCKIIIYTSSFKEKAIFDKEDPIISMTQRDRFDAKLVQYAIDYGADFFDKKSIGEVQIFPEEIQIELKEAGKINAKLLIGADGVISTVARESRLFTKHRFIGVCVLEDIPLENKIIKEYFTNDYTCHIHHQINNITGYGWVFPKKDSINVGIVDYISFGKKRNNLNQIFQTYLSFLKNQKIIPNTIKSKKTKGGILPFYPLEKTYTNHVILCGDAAGFINPLTGEGIYYAMTSGEIAAKISKKAIDNNDTSEEYLSKYEYEWKSDIGKEIRQMMQIAKSHGKESKQFINLLTNNKQLLEKLFQ